MTGRVKVARINVDDNPLTAERFRIQSIPALLILKSGREIDQIVGMQSKAEIVHRLMREILDAHRRASLFAKAENIRSRMNARRARHHYVLRRCDIELTSVCASSPPPAGTGKARKPPRLAADLFSGVSWPTIILKRVPIEAGLLPV